MKTLYNVYHPEIRTRVSWSSYDESQIIKTGETPWDYIQRTNPRKAKAILKRMDDSQILAIDDLWMESESIK